MKQGILASVSGTAFALPAVESDDEPVPEYVPSR